MDRIVTSCNNCPFCLTDVDYECVGNDTLIKCALTDMNERPSSIIASYHSSDLYSGCCDYCEEFGYKDLSEKFDESMCKCNEIHQKQADRVFSKINFNPNWCPLKELKTLNIIYDKNV